MVPTLSCPLLGLFGEEDPNPSPEHATRLQEELDRHGKTYTFHMYRDAGHAFFADYRPSYRAAPAQDMWHRVMLFYDRHLKV
jgi:carboxymethylenebutenolidase